MPDNTPREFLSGRPLTKEEKKPKSSRGRKSLKEIDGEWENIEIPEDEVLFQKQYYSVGEVAAMFHVTPSLIRFWDNEFDMVQPRKSRKGTRRFKPADVKLLHLIYDLLRRRKFTIEGAKDYLKNQQAAEERFALIQSLQKLKSFLLEIKASL